MRQISLYLREVTPKLFSNAHNKNVKGFMTSEDSDSFRILHLSDIHFGATFDVSLWEYIVALIHRECPRLIVCTGDLVDHGGLFMLALARKQLESLNLKAPITHQLRCVPGNHDCGPWGNLKFPPFSTNFQAVFGAQNLGHWKWVPTFISYRNKPLISRWIWRLALTIALYSHKWGNGVWRFMRLHPPLRPLPITREDDPDEVALIYLDSNHTPWLASGSVDVGELTKLKSVVLNMRDQKGSRPFVPRIALIHHHPLPIPDAKITEGLTSFEPFLVLRNAGIVLKELNRCDVDLVLHGHRHYTHFARLGYSIDHRVEGELAVLAAGSAGVTHSEAGRNSLNFIDVFRSGRLTYTSISFGGGAGEPVTELFRDTRYIHGMDMHKRRVHRRGIERHGQWHEKVVHDVAIDARGVALVSHGVSGLKFERELKGSSLPIYIEVAMGRVPPSTLCLNEKSIRQGHMLLHRPSKPENKIKCAIDLGQSLVAASPSMEFGYEYLSFNTYSISEWETNEAYESQLRTGNIRGATPGLEFTGFVIRAPIRQLVMRISLPESSQSPDPSVRVMRWHSYPDLRLDDARQFYDDAVQKWIHDADLTNHESGHLVRIGTNKWEMKIDYPLVGHRYDVTWRIHDDIDQKSNGPTEIVRRGLAKSFREIFLHLDQKSAYKIEVDRWLSTFRAILSNEFLPTVSGVDDLEVALFVYEDQTQSLSLVGHASASPSVEGKQMSFKVPLNEGVIGAAFKRRVVVSYVDPTLSGNGDDAAYLYQPNSPDGPDLQDKATDPQWKFVVAFPIFAVSDYSQPFGDASSNSEWSPAATVGVLTLASSSADSGLVKITHPKINSVDALSVATPAKSVQIAEYQDANGNIGTIEGAIGQVGLGYRPIWALSHLVLKKLLDVGRTAGTEAPGPEPSMTETTK